jgi:hypothetical protein
LTKNKKNHSNSTIRLRMDLIKRICKICLIQHLYQDHHLDFQELMVMLNETL